MSRLHRPASAVSLTAMAVLLSGCNLDLLEYSNQLKDEQRVAERIQDMHATAFAAMPTTGSASFVGFGNLYIDRERNNQGDGIFIIGDATLEADFESGSLTGVIGNFEGATNVRLNGRDEVVTEDVVAVTTTGQIDLGLNESIIGNDVGSKTARPNDWLMDYSGTIVAGGESYVLDGEIDGQFYGTRVDNPNTDFPIKGLAGGEELYSGSIATLESDGSVFDSNLLIVAENPVIIAEN